MLFCPGCLGTAYLHQVGQKTNRVSSGSGFNKVRGDNHCGQDQKQKDYQDLHADTLNRSGIATVFIHAASDSSISLARPAVVKSEWQASPTGITGNARGSCTLASLPRFQCGMPHLQDKSSLPREGWSAHTGLRREVCPLVLYPALGPKSLWQNRSVSRSRYKSSYHGPDAHRSSPVESWTSPRGGPRSG